MPFAEMVERARLDENAHFVGTWCSSEDLARFGVTFDETEGLIDVLRQSAEAEVSCVIREEVGAGNRVSLRSTGSIDVGELARRFGGGGHWFMAGFLSQEPVEVILDVLDAAVRDAPPLHLPSYG